MRERQSPLIGKQRDSGGKGKQRGNKWMAPAKSCAEQLEREPRPRDGQEGTQSVLVLNAVHHMMFKRLLSITV